LHPTYYRGFWHVVSRCLFVPYRHNLQKQKEFTTRGPSILHAASLGQAFAHCRIFPVATTRRCMGRVSVPLWLTILSDQLPVVALVGHYPTNKLIGRGLISKRLATFPLRGHWKLPRLSASYVQLRGRFPRITHPSAIVLRPSDLHA
jgi:hypothetical protein